MNLIDVVRLVATLYSILIFARVIISWMGSGSTHPLVLLVYRLTEPVLAPVRSILPSFGGLDFSPVLVLIGIQVLERVLIKVRAGTVEVVAPRRTLRRTIDRLWCMNAARAGLHPALPRPPR